jgi:hypothetical protein
MYTSMMLVAMATFTSAAESADGPAWQTNYGAARKLGAGQKPLAVFIGSGKQGWNKVAEEGLSSESRKVLAERYVSVYVNVDTAEGQRLARAFRMSNGLGIVISDRTGELQAFRHEGDLAERDLVRYLLRYGDPDRVVTSTETNPGRSREIADEGYYRAAPVVQSFGGGRGCSS